ncbi:MAG: sensor histidine kinase [Ginsengibacter sp.]
MKKSAIVLLHIGYWVLYLFLVTILLMSLNADKRHLTLNFWGIALFDRPFGFGAILPAIFGFYTFYSILFDRYLAKKKISKLFLSAIVFSLIGSIITEIIIFFIFHGKEINWGFSDTVAIVLPLAIIFLINGLSGLVLKVFINWFNDIKCKLELNKKNYELELALVKSQINPHFLFNTINNIDVLITKDPTRASAYLNKLSDIMRFMLYETKPAKIALSKELTYIEKFIELQKIRTTNEHYINYSAKGDPTNFMIPPMLLIPFIENAFKHAENKKDENTINIKIDIEKEKLIFECENYYNQNTIMKHEQGGLGSELIKNRLALLYPGKHTLTITNNNSIYKVVLSLY